MYEVKPVVCDYGVFDNHEDSNGEPLLILNSINNANLIRDILEEDDKHQAYKGIEFDKHAMICLVKGSKPNYEVMNDPLIERCGSFWGGFVGNWDWKPNELEKLSIEELWTIYKICKTSWNK